MESRNHLNEKVKTLRKKQQGQYQTDSISIIIPPVIRIALRCRSVLITCRPGSLRETRKNQQGQGDPQAK